MIYKNFGINLKSTEKIIPFASFYVNKDIKNYLGKIAFLSFYPINFFI